MVERRTVSPEAAVTITTTPTKARSSGSEMPVEIKSEDKKRPRRNLSIETDLPEISIRPKKGGPSEPSSAEGEYRRAPVSTTSSMKTDISGITLQRTGDDLSTPSSLAADRVSTDKIAKDRDTIHSIEKNAKQDPVDQDSKQNPDSKHLDVPKAPTKKILSPSVQQLAMEQEATRASQEASSTSQTQELQAELVESNANVSNSSKTSAASKSSAPKTPSKSKSKSKKDKDVVHLGTISSKTITQGAANAAFRYLF